MNNKKSIGEIVKVTISNFFKLLSGVLVGFLLPKIIGIEDYGYYKTFTLYATYVGLFCLGIIDGIYLKYGGYEYEKLDKSQFRFYTRFLILIQFLISVVGLIFSMLFIDNELKFIFICLSVYLFCNNLTGYFQMISQITKRFKELSFRLIVQSLLTSIVIVALWIVSKFTNYQVGYEIFTIFYVGIYVILTLWYIYTYREITFGRATNYSNEKRNIRNFIFMGVPLLIANLCNTLILTIDRQFVNILFPNETYAVYAFAYNMLSLVTTATSAISCVLYPTIRKSDIKVLIKNYSNLITVILSLVFIALTLYYPLVWFINLFLPKYNDSLLIFRIIFPGIAINSAITVIMQNYYKILNKNFAFFIKSLIILIISFFANLIAYLIFRNTISISIASVSVMILWYILIEIYLVKKIKVKWKKNIVFLLFMMSCFYIITSITNVYIGFVLHLFITISMILLFNFKQLKTYFIGRKNNESEEKSYEDN